MLPEQINTHQAQDYARIEAAIRFIEENYQDQPTLEEVATHLHLSPFHLQRLFKKWAGISPKRFLQFLTREHAQQLLANSQSVLDTTYDLGLSSPSRLHDLFVTIDAITPSEYKNAGEGLEITYGFHATPFGECLLAITDRGICGLYFVTAAGRQTALDELQQNWPNASYTENSIQTEEVANRVFPINPTTGRQEVTLLLKGTNFQIKVWEALLRIPPLAVCSYGDLANMIGKPKAVRAVGSAVGRNAVAYLIPCHRVIRQSGITNGYRWGSPRKKAILPGNPPRPCEAAAN